MLRQRASARGSVRAGRLRIGRLRALREKSALAGGGLNPRARATRCFIARRTALYALLPRRRSEAT